MHPPPRVCVWCRWPSAVVDAGVQAALPPAACPRPTLGGATGADPGQLLILHMTFASKLSETLKEFTAM